MDFLHLYMVIAVENPIIPMHFEAIKTVESFIKNFWWTTSQPAPPSGQFRKPPVFLPAFTKNIANHIFLVNSKWG